jgi:ArsR family transcriptional regulator
MEHSTRDELVHVMKALSDRTRMKIIELLLERGHKMCVNALASQLDITQSAVSQHLRILRQADLVESDRNGYYVHYSVNDDRLRMVAEMLGNLLE